METHNTHTKRKDVLYFSPLVAVVLGFVFMAIANSQPYVAGGPITPEGDFFWTGALVLFGAGILGEIIALGLYIWRTRAANASQQSIQDSDQ